MLISSSYKREGIFFASSHQLRFNRNMYKNHDLIHQYTHFPMCRSAPPSISNIIERLLVVNPELQEVVVVVAGFADWTLEEEQEEEEQHDLIDSNNNNNQWFPTFENNNNDDDDDDILLQIENEEEEERQADVYRGLRRPRDDEDWRQISERFREQMSYVTGVMTEFREWENAFEEEEEEEEEW